MTEEKRPDDTTSPDEREVEIARTRAAIQQDIKAIGEKFSPSAVKEQAKRVLSDAKEEGANMIRETKDKAVEAVRHAGESAVESAQEMAHDLGDRARRVGEMTADYARRGGQYARQAGAATGDFVTDNAVPLSLIGLGVGWLVLSMRKQRAAQMDQDFHYRGFEYAGYEEDYPGADDYSLEVGQIRPRRATNRTGEVRDRVEGAAHAARERVEGMAHAARERMDDVAESAKDLAQRAREGVGAAADSARDRVGALAERATHGVEVARTRVSNAASQLGHQASELSHEARERLNRAQLRTRDFADENPLAVGAIAIAAGVGIGLLLPATQPENKLMGGTRDRLVGDARGLLRDVRDAGNRLGDTARDAARDVKSAVTEQRVSH